jgi:site-specific DNA-methyltransferase (adenine-specific)
VAKKTRKTRTVDWRNEDATQLLGGPALRGKADLLIADPPFNYGLDYADYVDSLSNSEYRNWTRDWLMAADRALARHGTAWLFFPDEWVADVDVMVRSEIGWHRRGWVVWAFGFGVACQKGFSRAHTHVLYYTKTKSVFTFNDAAVRVLSNRQLVYNDRRANPRGKLPDNVWVLTKEAMDAVLPADGDVWYESRVCGTYRERQEHSPNQIPVSVMERIVLATGDPGDLVVDPFCGTGSSGEAAALAGRNYLGNDISPTCVERSRERVAAALARRSA